MRKWRPILAVLLLVLAGCGGNNTNSIPTKMVLPTPTPTISAFTGPTNTPLPEIVGVPTPTPLFNSPGIFISKLKPGELVEGTLADPTQKHVYLFDGKKGQYVTLEMRHVSGAIDPVLTLFSPSGVSVATDDNSAANNGALLRNINLTEDGVYSVQAFGGGEAGDYRISFASSNLPFAVTPDFSGIPPTATPIQEILTPTLATAVSGNRLEDHVPVIGLLDRGDDFDRYPIFATAGEVLTISARPLPEYEGLGLKLEVFGPSGGLVASGASSTSNLDGDVVIFPVRIETTGAYVVFIRAEVPAIGKYLISYGTGSSSENIMQGEVLPNQPTEGEIIRHGTRDVWSAFLNQGDIIMAAVTSVDGVFDPILEIAEGNSLDAFAVDDNSGNDRNALLSSVPIGKPGLYHFRVKAAQAASTGKYTLIWRYVNLSPTATPVPGTLLLLAVEDTVPDSTYQFYPFQGEAGQQVEIQVIADPSSEFDPVAVLIGPDGQELVTGDDSEGSLNPRFTTKLPVTGTYNVRVNGYLKGGAFELTVKALF